MIPNLPHAAANPGNGFRVIAALECPNPLVLNLVESEFGLNNHGGVDSNVRVRGEKSLAKAVLPSCRLFVLDKDRTNSSSDQ